MQALTLVVSLLLSQTAPVPTQELLTMERAQELARKNNLDLQLAQERLGRAQILSKKAWALLLPTITAEGQWVRNNQAVTFGFDELIRGLGFTPPDNLPSFDIQKLQSKNASANINWPLFNGRSIPLIMNAYDSVDVAELSFTQTQAALSFATALAYFNVLNANRQVEIRHRSLDNRKAHLTLERARLKVGEATEVTTLRSEVEVATEEQALIQAENAARIAARALAVLIGWMDKDGVVPEFAVARPELATPAKEDMVQQAYATRLDLKSQGLQLDIAKRSKAESWLKFLPVLAGTGTYRWTDTEGFSGENTSWQVGLLLRWTLFEGGQTFWELQERQHDINSAMLGIEKTRQDIAKQITEAKLNLDSAQASHQASVHRVELARRTSKLVDAQYEVGAATQLDVLDAGRTLADAETSEALSQLSEDVARLSLEHTLLIPPGAANNLGGVAVAADVSATAPLE